MNSQQIHIGGPVSLTYVRKAGTKLPMTKFIPLFVSSGLRSRRIAISNGRFRRTVPTNGPSFELAYQARVAIDRIRFAIREGESVAPEHPVLVEARMQLLDALDRLENAERHFQQNFRGSLSAPERPQFTRASQVQSAAGTNESIS